MGSNAANGDERQPQTSPTFVGVVDAILATIQGESGDRVSPLHRDSPLAASCDPMSVVPFLLDMSPAQLLEGTEHDLDALLSASARTRLLHGAATLGLPARTVCLECRLNDDERVDLALCLATHTVGLGSALQSLGRRYASDPHWQRCIHLLASWANGEEKTLAGVPFLFTAFDLATAVSDMPVPCLSLCTDPAFFMRRLGLPMPRAPLDSPLQVLDACQTSLDADWVTPSLRGRAAQLLQSADDIEVRQLSLMLARQPPTLKLDLTLPAGELGRFLHALGWQADAADVVDQLRTLAPWQKRVQLNCVVGSSAQQLPIEAELCCTGPDEPNYEQRAVLLERLWSAGIANVAKTEALLALLRRPVVTDSKGQWMARNWYIKLRFVAGRVESAKAYIGLMQRSSRPSPQQPAQQPNSH